MYECISYHIHQWDKFHNILIFLAVANKKSRSTTLISKTSIDPNTPHWICREASEEGSYTKSMFRTKHNIYSKDWRPRRGKNSKKTNWQYTQMQRFVPGDWHLSAFLNSSSDTCAVGIVGSLNDQRWKLSCKLPSYFIRNPILFRI